MDSYKAFSIKQVALLPFSDIVNSVVHTGCKDSGFFVASSWHKQEMSNKDRQIHYFELNLFKWTSLDLKLGADDYLEQVKFLHYCAEKNCLIILGINCIGQWEGLIVFF